MNIHGSCILIGPAGEQFGAPPDGGVLLLGESGRGKSDLALRLMDRGAVLVSDDRTELFLREGVLHARPVGLLKGLLEIRNVGIVEFPYAAGARIVLAIDLDPNSARERLPEPEWYDPPSDLAVPQDAKPRLLRLDASESSAPAKVIAAVAAYEHARVRSNRKLGGDPSLQVEMNCDRPNFRNSR